MTAEPAQQDAIPGVARYQVREPILLEAIYWTGLNSADVEDFARGAFEIEQGTGIGRLWNRGRGKAERIPPFSWVMRGVTGDFFARSAEDFAATYELADGQRPGDQQLPVPNDGPSMHDLVLADLEIWTGPEADAVRALLAERKRIGLERYGSLLQAHNGRDWLRDLREELSDAAVYARQGLEEAKAGLGRLKAVEAYEAVLIALETAHEIGGEEALRG